MVLVSVGADASPTAIAYLRELIGPGDTYTVYSKSNTGFTFGANPTGSKDIYIDFADFTKLDFHRKITDKRTFSIGTNFFHEARHASTGLSDPDPPLDKTTTGPIVDFVNQIRRERGMPRRGPGYAGTHKTRRWQHKIGINFQNVNSRRPNKVYYVYYPQTTVSRARKAP